jgi:hypothetical protein
MKHLAADAHRGTHGPTGGPDCFMLAVLGGIAASHRQNGSPMEDPNLETRVVVGPVALYSRNVAANRCHLPRELLNDDCKRDATETI